MRIVLFAHTPPPHHGQSQMVQLMLNGLGGDRRKQPRAHADEGEVCFFHVNAKLSDEVSDIGRAGPKKLLRLLWFIAQAIWCRFRHRAPYLFYVPAPPLKAAVYRDWIVMALCRPFFKGVIFHWHAAGLGGWLDKEARPWQRQITERLLRAPDLSIVLGEHNRQDALRLHSKAVSVVPNAILDPCPDYGTAVEPLRIESARRRRAILDSFKVLYIGLCFREKGLFDLIEAVALANRTLAASASPGRLHLTVAGNFAVAAEKAEFEQRISGQDLRGAVDYRGFVGGAAKRQLLLDSDCLAFPTYYSAESFGLVLLEAMAYGLPIVAARWRTIPEVLPPEYPGLVEPRRPEQIAAALLAAATAEHDPRLRERFLARYTDAVFVENLRTALLAATAAP